MTEKQIEQLLVDGVKKIGGRAYKWISPGNNGVPDRIVFIPGRVPIFVELKRPGGELTGLQKSQIERLRGFGQAVYVIDSLKKLKDLLTGLTGGDAV